MHPTFKPPAKAIVVCTIELGFLWSYFHMGSYPNLCIASAGPQAILYEGIYSGALLLCFIGLLIGGQGASRTFLVNRPALLGVGVAGCLGCLLLLACTAPSLYAPILAPVGLVLSAFFVSTYLVALGIKSSQGSPGETVVIVLGSYVFFRMLILLQGPLGLDLSYISPFVLTAAMAVFPNEQPRSQATALRSVQNAPWGLCAAALALILTATLFLDIYTENSVINEGGELGRQLVNCLIALLLVPAAIALFKHHGPTMSTLGIAIVIMAILYCGSWIATLLVPECHPLISALKQTLVPFAWLALSLASSTRRLLPAPLFSILGICVLSVHRSLSFGIIHQVGIVWLISQSVFSRWILVGVLACIVGLAIYLVLHRYARASHAPSSSHPDATTALCAQATEPYGLSSRELEVVVLIYRGHSAKMIGERLGLSPSTIRNNTLRAYRKMGVHSKQELIELIDRCREEYAAP